MQAETRSLNVVSHNLANANTEGYTRQYAVHEASYPYCYPIYNQKITYGQLGTGVEISHIRRFRDLYLDNQWREVASSVGYWNGMVNTLKKVEYLIQEPDPDYKYGTQALISDFFNVWSELNHYRHDLGVKEAVIQAAVAMTNAFRQTCAQIGNVKENTDKLINDTVDRINEVAKQISELSKEIDRVMRVGQNPNDLLDKRDLLLDELSTYGVMVQKVIPVPASAITEEALANAPNDKHPGYIEVSFCGKIIVDGDNNYYGITRGEADAWAGVYTEENLKVINGLIQRIANFSNILTRIDDIDAQLNYWDTNGPYGPGDTAYDDLVDERQGLLAVDPQAKLDMLLKELRNYGTVDASNLPELSFHGKQVIDAGGNVIKISSSDPTVTWTAAKSETGLLMGYIDGLKKIDKYLGQFDELAKAITEEVNMLHTVGNAEVVAGTALNIGPASIANSEQLVLNMDGKTITVTFSDVKNNSDVVSQINAALDKEGYAGRAYINGQGNLAIRSYGGVSTEVAVDTVNSDAGVLTALGLTGPNAVLTSTSNSGYPVFFVIADALGSGKEGAPYFFVNPYLMENPVLVNSDNAMNIFDLCNAKTMVDGTTTFNGFYNAIVTGIGADVKAAEDRLGTQSAVMLQVDNMRESLIGVNEDEELTLMLQFNRSYQASSRMITVMDGLLDVLINRTAV